MKSRTPSFVIELGLKTGEDQESALETYFSDAPSSSMLFLEQQRNACAP